MQKNKKINGYIINLDESKERFDALEKNLDDLNLKGNYERFSAIQVKQGKGKVSSKELGCLLSHLNVIKNASDDKLIHIIEDDTYFPKNFPKNLEAILSQKTKLEWDIVFLSMGINTDIITIKKFIDLKKNAISAANKSDHITYIDGKYYVFGNQSYILNPLKKEKIISMLIENTDGDTLPIDIFLKNKILRGELSAFISFPFLTGINTQFKTTINDRPTHDDNFVLMMNKLINIFVENDDETSIKEEEQIINQDILNIKEIFYSYLTK